MEKILEIKDLKKSYGNIQAVKGIDFYVEKGKLFAFLGPNGAGKSTTIDMICTFLKPDSGTIIVDDKEVGKDDDEIRKSIGVVFQDSLLDKTLTVEENLMMRGQLYEMKKSEVKEAVAEAIELAHVKEFAHQPYGKLSGGQRRRCDIARALINKPKILFLDEPTTGLDPQTRQAVWETILDMQKKYNMTLFLTTHYMEEAINADFVMIMDSGKIVAQGSPSYLRETYARNYLKLTTKNPEETNEIKVSLNQRNIEYQQVADQIVVKIEETKDAVPLINEFVGKIDSFEVIKGTMDDAFIEITGRELK